MADLGLYCKNGYYSLNYVAVYRLDPTFFSVFKSRKSAEHHIAQFDAFDILTFRQACRLYPDFFNFSK